MKITAAALLIVTATILTPAAASAQICGVGLIAAAMIVNAQEHRELTDKEAATCGLLIGHDQRYANSEKAKRAKKAKRIERTKKIKQHAHRNHRQHKKLRD